MTGIEFSFMTALKVVGGVVSAISSMRQAAAQKDAAEFNAAVNRNNAIAARQQAEADAKEQERDKRLRAGANRASLGGSGVSIEGSPLDVLGDIAAEEELDRLKIVHNGELRATGFENNAQLDTMRAKSQSGIGGAASSILGVAGSLGGGGSRQVFGSGSRYHPLGVGGGMEL